MLTLIGKGLKKLAVEILIVGCASGLIIFALQMLPMFKKAPAATAGISDLNGKPLAAVGGKLSLQRAQFAKHSLNLVLVSSPTCTFCLRSSSFHHRLQGEALKNDVGFYVAIPDRKRAANYIKDASFLSSTVFEWKDLGESVEGTPTLLAIASNGTILEEWKGLVDLQVEKQIIKDVDTQSVVVAPHMTAVDGFRNYSRTDLPKLEGSEHVQIVDAVERNQYILNRGETNIPFAELSVRARYELDPKSLQVVDCSDLAPLRCQATASMLKADGFRVATLERGAFYSSCLRSAVH